MAASRVDLHFSMEESSWALVQVHFVAPNQESQTSFRGDRFQRTGITFAWTKATRALSLLFVKHVLGKPIEGDKTSPAQTLFHFLEHPERSAAAVPFTLQDGYCYLKAFVQNANTIDSDTGRRLRRVWIDPALLPPSNVTITLDGQLCTSAATLDALQAQLAEPWKKPSQKTSSRHELGHFPMLTNALHGRAELLRQLEQFSDPIVFLCGAGGAGKTALLSKFIQQQGASGEAANQERSIFAWSFAEQHRASEQTLASDNCFRALLEFLGDPHQSNTSYQLGQRAASALQRGSTLLVLDGIDPLLVATGPETGMAHDPALRGFLAAFCATTSASRCFISSRLEPKTAFESCVLRIDQLDPAASEAILQDHQVFGSPQEFERLLHIAKGHPLTLHLMGSYLLQAHQGNARALAEDTFLRAPDARHSSAAQTIMHSHQTRLAGSPQELALHLISLFDDAIPLDTLADLIFQSPLASATGSCFQHSSQVRQVIADLASADLLLPGPMVESHPLVRQHFRQSFAKQNPTLYTQAHAWLYQQVVDDASIPFIPTEKAHYEKLLRAFPHGREAGRLAECWEDIAWKRLMRQGREYHMTAHLGEFHLCLRTWASFWQTPWEKLHPDLPKHAHPIVQASAGFALFMIERVEESERVLQRAMRNAMRQVRPQHGLQPAAVLGFVRARQQRFQEATRLLTPICHLARWVGADAPDHVVLSPLCHLALCASAAGQGQRAERLFLVAQKRAREYHPTGLPPLLLTLYWKHLAQSAQLKTLQAQIEQHLPALNEVPLLRQTGMVTNLQARCHLLDFLQNGSRSAVRQAQELSELACETSQSHGWSLFHYENLSTHIHLLNALGRPTAALRDEAQQIAQRLGIQPLPMALAEKQALAAA